jgi:UPF0755 protein
VAAILLLLVAMLLWQQAYGRYSLPDTVVMVEPGMASARVAARLEQAGVIPSATTFRWLARLSGKAARLKVGEYRFAGETSVHDVLAKIARGEVVHHQVTVPEGLRNDEVIALLARATDTEPGTWQSVLQRLLDGREAEGRLLPETYDYTLPLKPELLLEQMLKAQRNLLVSLGVDHETEAERLLIIASIIEKETAIDSERPLVSSVIENRLHYGSRGMPLQMDSTVIYGLWRTEGHFSGNLHKCDLRHDTPWNTYTRRGLPPTPICNPGAASLKAAAHPAESDYLYFVADGSGGHAFAVTGEEHNRNVRKWIQIDRERNRAGP